MVQISEKEKTEKVQISDNYKKNIVQEILYYLIEEEHG